MPNRSVRLLRPGDERLLARLAHQFYENALAESRAKSLLARHGHFLLCVLEGQTPAGFCYFHILPRWYDGVSEVFLYDIEVAEAHRRKGYGRQLLQSVFQMAKEKGAATVWLMVERSNAPALLFYEKMGGRIQPEEGLLVEFHP